MDKNVTPQKDILKFLDQYKEQGKEFGAGSVFGFAAGFASRYILKYTILITGLSYLALQGLSQTGYISVNWEKINSLTFAAFRCE